MPSFSPNLEQTLHRSLAEANNRRHEYATLEHLLMGLMDDQDAIAVLRACGVNLDRLRIELVAYLDHELDNLRVEDEEDFEATPTAGFQRVVQRAILHVQSSGREEMTGANILVALFSERESHAVYFLQAQDMTRLDAVSYISHGVAKASGLSEPRTARGAEKDAGGEGEEAGETALASYCVDLNARALEGKIDPLIGREPEIERTIQILCRRAKNNPLYVGDPGLANCDCRGSRAQDR